MNHCVDVVAHMLNLADEDAARAALPAARVAATGGPPAEYRQVFGMLADVPARAALKVLQACPRCTAGSGGGDPFALATVVYASLT